MVIDRFNGQSSVSAAAKDLGPKLNVEAETLWKWVVQAQAHARAMPGETTAQLAEMVRQKGESSGSRAPRDKRDSESGRVFLELRKVDPHHR
jgi:transposase-like protein